jgi:hypothetical protein
MAAFEQFSSRHSGVQPIQSLSRRRKVFNAITLGRIGLFRRQLFGLARDFVFPQGYLTFPQK